MPKKLPTSKRLQFGKQLDLFEDLITQRESLIYFGEATQVDTVSKQITDARKKLIDFGSKP